MHLNGFDSAGNPAATPSADFPNAAAGVTRCTNDATTTNLTVGATPVTVKVVKDKSKTAEKASYSAKKDIAKGTATVKSRFGTPATGRVTFTLKKGTKIVKTGRDTLNRKGVASFSFKGVKAKGKYSIIGKYRQGSDKALKGSSGKKTFTVR